MFFFLFLIKLNKSSNKSHFTFLFFKYFFSYLYFKIELLVSLSFLCYFSFKSLCDLLISLNKLIKNSIFLCILFSITFKKNIASQRDFLIFFIKKNYS